METLLLGCNGQWNSPPSHPLLTCLLLMITISAQPATQAPPSDLGAAPRASGVSPAAAPSSSAVRPQHKHGCLAALGALVEGDPPGWAAQLAQEGPLLQALCRDIAEVWGCGAGQAGCTAMVAAGGDGPQADRAPGLAGSSMRAAAALLGALVQAMEQEDAARVGLVDALVVSKLRWNRPKLRDFLGLPGMQTRGAH